MPLIAAYRGDMHIRSADILWNVDNPGDAWMIRHALADATAMTLRVAATAADATEPIGEGRPDLLVLDTIVARNTIIELCR